MVFPPAAERSLHPEIEDDGDAEEKGQTLLKSDGMHGTPPAKNTTPSNSSKLEFYYQRTSRVAPAQITGFHNQIQTPQDLAIP
jgi:hypothetical protein